MPIRPHAARLLDLFTGPLIELQTAGGRQVAHEAKIKSVRLGAIVHHTDADREYAYDRDTHFGRLADALDAAVVNKWTVVDMKKDWKTIFAFEKR